MKLEEVRKGLKVRIRYQLQPDVVAIVLDTYPSEIAEDWIRVREIYPMWGAEYDALLEHCSPIFTPRKD